MSRSFACMEQFSLFHTGSLLFRLANPWRETTWSSGSTVREHPPAPAHFPWTERHLQCLWADPRYLPENLETFDGQCVRVLDAGSWNLEAGPDFLGATLEIGPDRRVVHGDVEIHIRTQGWTQHNHHLDAIYQKVILHVSWFKGPSQQKTLPPGCLELALRHSAEQVPGFSLDVLDLSAYPYAFPKTNPVQELLTGCSPNRVQALLDAAGAERLLRRKERMQFALDESDGDQVLYEEVLAALGYAKNSAGFRLLARKVPLSTLRHLSGENPEAAEAILLGVAGLLRSECPGNRSGPSDLETIRHHRRLWSFWWAHRGEFAGREMHPGDWVMQGRPANRPERRIAAAARLFSDTGFTTLLRNPELRRERLLQKLACTGSDFFHCHMTFGGRSLSRPCALIGRERAQTILINQILPWMEATGLVIPDDMHPSVFSATAHGDRVVRETAAFLFGPDHTPRLYATALRQQGLHQIFQDFLVDRRPEKMADLLHIVSSMLR